MKVCCGDTALLTKPLLCLRLRPWYFECIIVYAWHECFDGILAEAGLLVALLACLVILLRGAPDSLDGA